MTSDRWGNPRPSTMAPSAFHSSSGAMAQDRDYRCVRSRDVQEEVAAGSLKTPRWLALLLDREARQPQYQALPDGRECAPPDLRHYRQAWRSKTLDYPALRRRRLDKALFQQIGDLPLDWAANYPQSARRPGVPLQLVSAGSPRCPARRLWRRQALSAKLYTRPLTPALSADHVCRSRSRPWRTAASSITAVHACWSSDRSPRARRGGDPMRLFVASSVGASSYSMPRSSEDRHGRGSTTGSGSANSP